MDRTIQRIRHQGTFAGLALVSVLGLVTSREATAQNSKFLLTVQPRTMATGTTNPAAGEHRLDSGPLDSLLSTIVVVPPQCVGARRCPLLVHLANRSAVLSANWTRPMADKYGIIVLAVNGPQTANTGALDTVLTEVLQRFAIDPEKIGVIGHCNGTLRAAALGTNNPHVFTRIAALSGRVVMEELDLRNTTVEFLFDGGINEAAGALKEVKALRQNGNPVRHTMTIRGHERQEESYDWLGRWLSESWATPPARRPSPTVVANPLPVLTADALTRMVAFWTRFLQEPDSIRTTARRALMRDVVVPLGREQLVSPMVDMTALAAKYPSVAAAFKETGLTAQQHDAYRVALLSAMAAWGYIRWSPLSDLGSPEETASLATSLAFLDEHPDELVALASAGVKDRSDIAEGILANSTHPAESRALDPLGIWRTP